MDQKWALFSFKGRLRRRDYWLYSLPVLLVTMPVFWYTNPSNMGNNQALNILAMMILFFVFWASLALNIKRLHDRNKSAWWALLTFVPLIGPAFVIVELGMLDGIKGDNQYGPDPKGRFTPTKDDKKETITIDM